LVQIIVTKAEEEITPFSRGSIYVEIMFISNTYYVRTSVLARAALQSWY